MSMKRSKQRGAGGGREKDHDSSFWSKPAEPEKSWAELVENQPDEAFAPYTLTERYTKGQLVSHGKFGKGVVVGVDGGRVEILFQDGKRKLGHGQA
jgi:hypothetical protein